MKIYLYTSKIDLEITENIVSKLNDYAINFNFFLGNKQLSSKNIDEIEKIVNNNNGQVIYENEMVIDNSITFFDINQLDNEKFIEYFVQHKLYGNYENTFSQTTTTDSSKSFYAKADKFLINTVFVTIILFVILIFFGTKKNLRKH